MGNLAPVAIWATGSFTSMSISVDGDKDLDFDPTA